MIDYIDDGSTSCDKEEADIREATLRADYEEYNKWLAMLGEAENGKIIKNGSKYIVKVAISRASFDPTGEQATYYPDIFELVIMVEKWIDGDETIKTRFTYLNHEHDMFQSFEINNSTLVLDGIDLSQDDYNEYITPEVINLNANLSLDNVNMVGYVNLLDELTQGVYEDIISSTDGVKA